MQIVLAGFGNMGQALARGWLQADGIDGSVTVVDPNEAARAAAAALGLSAVVSADRVAGNADVAVLAVKPAEIDVLMRTLPPARLYLSVAAGRTLRELSSLTEAGAGIVRAMPNTPAAIGLGATGLCANEHVTPAGRDLASTLMRAVGIVEWVDDEGLMDVVTAVSGSGPAYVFLLMESLTRAAVALGLDQQTAARLATATVRGAGSYAMSASKDATELRKEVTSPNGTTEAALNVLLDDEAFHRLLDRAVQAAVARSRELGEGGS